MMENKLLFELGKMRVDDLLKHNYGKKLLAAGLDPAHLYHVDIAHDDWCAIFSGGYCDCDPEVRSTDLGRTSSSVRKKWNK